MFRYQFFIIDLLLLTISFFLSLFISIEDIFSRRILIEIFINYYYLYLSISFLVFFYYKDFQIIYKFFSSTDLIKLTKSYIIINSIFFGSIFFIDRLSEIPRSFMFVHFLLGYIFLVSVRFINYSYQNKNSRNVKNISKIEKIIIIGNLEKCNEFIRTSKVKGIDKEIVVVGVIINNKTLIPGSLRGIPILGNTKSLENIWKNINHSFGSVVVVSDLEQEKINFLYSVSINKFKIYEVQKDYILQNKKEINLKKIHVESLLGRKKIKLYEAKLESFFSKKIIMVTGAAGSIGSEVVEQLINYNPKKIICLDNNEFSTFNLSKRIESKNYKNPPIIIIGDVKNKNKIEKLIKNHNPDIVIHAAAHKHVSLSESNPDEAINTNIFGTKNVIDLSYKNKVKYFLLISTDKAVEPSSLMGLTKFISERYCFTYLSKRNFNVSIIRFGNVLSSNGSVVPIFEKKIQERREIEVTHKDVERFFMLPNEAVSLVLQSILSSSKNKNNFGSYLLDMGKPMKIINLARKMITLNGLIPGKDIKIKITGLKKGEKLSEKLFYENENPKKGKIKDIFELKINKNYTNIKKDLDHLQKQINKNLDNKKLLLTVWDIYKKQIKFWNKK